MNPIRPKQPRLTEAYQQLCRQILEREDGGAKPVDQCNTFRFTTGSSAVNREMIRKIT